MKMKLLVAGLVAIVAIFSPQNMVQAQELTDEQRDALTKMEEEAQEAALESELRALAAYAKLSPEERELRALESELRAAELEKIKEIITPRNYTPEERRALLLQHRKEASALESTRTISQKAVATVESEPSALLVGGDGEPQSLNFGSCGSDPTAFYNLPLFTATTPIIQWETDNEPTVLYPWGAYTPNGLDSSGRVAIQTLFGSPNFSSASVYIRLTNNFDVYGVPLRHRLSFQYQFKKGGINDAYTVTVNGVVVTNLPVSVNWRRVSIEVAPFPRFVTNTELRFKVFKNHATSLMPEGHLYAPQWCTEIRSTNVSVAITKTPATNFVSWSHESAPTNFWSLEFSPVIGPGAFWSSSIGTTPIVYSNTTAVVGFANNNPQRYYRLKRNW